MATCALASPVAALPRIRHDRHVLAVLLPTAARPSLRGTPSTRPFRTQLRPRSSHARRGPRVAHHSVIVPRADFEEDGQRAKDASEAAEKPRGTEHHEPVGHHKHSVRSFENEPGISSSSSGGGTYESVELHEDTAGAPVPSPSSSSARWEEVDPGRSALGLEDSQERSSEGGDGGRFAKARDIITEPVKSTAHEAGDLIEDRADEAVSAGKQAVDSVEDGAEDIGKAVSRDRDYVRVVTSEAQRATSRAAESGGKQTEQMAEEAVDSSQSGVAAAMDTEARAASVPTLFEQIGGDKAVSAVVDRFYDTLVEDARVKDVFANTDMARQRRMQKSFVSGVLGGKKYTGRSMRAAHQDLLLTDEHFQAVTENLEAALRHFKVPDGHVRQIMAVVATTKDDVLGRDPK